MFSSSEIGYRCACLFIRNSGQIAGVAHGGLVTTVSLTEGAWTGQWETYLSVSLFQHHWFLRLRPRPPPRLLLLRSAFLPFLLPQPFAFAGERF